MFKLFAHTCKESEPDTNMTAVISKPAHLPVVVHVAQLVGQPLHVIRLQSARVVHNVVVGRGDAAEADGLAHDVEVVPVEELRQLTTTEHKETNEQRLSQRTTLGG